MGRVKYYINVCGLCIGMRKGAEMRCSTSECRKGIVEEFTGTPIQVKWECSVNNLQIQSMSIHSYLKRKQNTRANICSRCFFPDTGDKSNVHVNGLLCARRENFPSEDRAAILTWHP